MHFLIDLLSIVAVLRITIQKDGHGGKERAGVIDGGSGRMKLIIDIPEVDYECAKQRWMRGNDAHKMDYYVSKGIPLDDVKAEIVNMEYHMIDCEVLVSQDEVLQILDNIGKESEEI